MREDSFLRAYLTDFLTHSIRKLGFEVIYIRKDEKYLLVTNQGKTHCFVIHCVKQTIARIPYQTVILARSFDYVTVFAQKKHQSLIENLLPENVGLMVVDLDNPDYLITVNSVGNLFEL